MSNEWEAGAQPWLRRHQESASWGPQSNMVQCVFCGAMTAKRSATDREQDPGRLELYCDNQFCDAREIVILVRRDGAEATFRADVRALNLIDDGTLDVHAMFPPSMKSSTMGELMADRGKEVERRMRQASLSDD